MKKLLVILTVLISIVIGPVAIAQEAESDCVVKKSMVIPYDGGELSHLTFTINDEAFTKLFSALSVGDVTSLWNDIIVLHRKTEVRTMNLFINSPGGDAFSGLALVDKIIMAKKLGFRVNAYASGIVASAAVPVFAVCDYRVAGEGTIFMVHETSLWKWPGRETASDIRSQNKLMNLLRERYLTRLASHSKLGLEEWGTLEEKTTWFDAVKAKEFGIVDVIESEE